MAGFTPSRAGWLDGGKGAADVAAAATGAGAGAGGAPLRFAAARTPVSPSLRLLRFGRSVAGAPAEAAAPAGVSTPPAAALLGVPGSDCSALAFPLRTAAPGAGDAAKGGERGSVPVGRPQSWSRLGAGALLAEINCTAASALLTPCTVSSPTTCATSSSAFASPASLSAALQTAAWQRR